MDKKKLIIAIALCIIAVFVLLRGITAQTKTRRGGVPTDAGLGQVRIQMPSEIDMQVKRRAARTKFKAWGRGPFVSGGGGSSSALYLSGILWDSKRPRAMIGDAIVGKGDMVASNKVVDIRRDRVILNDGLKDFELKLNQ